MFLEIYPLEADLHKPIHQTFINMTITFSKTKSSILKNVDWAKPLKTGFMSHFPDTSSAEFVSYCKLVQFWMAVNDWASYSRVDIILDRAFYTTNYHIPITTGWRHVVENSSYLFPSDFMFQEKTILINTNENL